MARCRGCGSWGLSAWLYPVGPYLFCQNCALEWRTKGREYLLHAREPKELFRIPSLENTLEANSPEGDLVFLERGLCFLGLLPRSFPRMTEGEVLARVALTGAGTALLLNWLDGLDAGQLNPAGVLNKNIRPLDLAVRMKQKELECGGEYRPTREDLVSQIESYPRVWVAKRDDIIDISRYGPASLAIKVRQGTHALVTMPPTGQLERLVSDQIGIPPSERTPQVELDRYGSMIQAYLAASRMTGSHIDTGKR